MSERAFEVEGKEVVIRTDGRVRRIGVPDGFEPKIYRHILAAVDVLYRRNGVLPTIGEVCKEWPDFSRTTVSKAFAEDEFKLALAARGVAFDATKGLSEDQLSALMVLSNPTDGRSTTAKLHDIGIPVARHRGWMRNPLYARLVNSQADQNLADAIPMALNQIIAKAESGDMRAAEKILEMTGRWNPQQQELQNARTVVLTFMEAMQKHVDPATLRLILADVQGKIQSQSIVSSMKEIS